MKFSLALIIICLSIGLFSCRKNSIDSSPSVKLNFSADTLTFDTVFTTVGSTTGSLKIYNPTNKSIIISDIRLAGGSSSHFRINIDGTATTESKSVEIAPKDSLYIFVAVTVDPNNQNNPFVITDSVLFLTNSNHQKVILEAWGQNAHFFNGATIQSNQVWTNDKPYVLVNNLIVYPNASLTIMPGCKIYSHPGSFLIVGGTLKVLGQPGDSVTFQGDRLEQFFQGLPGNWGGIEFLPPSHDNEIHNAIIRDGVQGIYDSASVTTPYNLKIYQTIIRNMLYSGIEGKNGSIYGENCLVFNAGQNDCAQLINGGNYDFEYCTFADYSNIVINHQNPTVYVSNYTPDQNGLIHLPAEAPLIATLRNCIVYGSIDKELILDNYTKDGISYNATVNTCFVKSTVAIKDTVGVTAGNIFYSDPMFLSSSNDNYHLTATSPCIGEAVSNNITVDLDNYPRGTRPDIGAYQFH